jgi:hypothetical protein
MYKKNQGLNHLPAGLALLNPPIGKEGEAGWKSDPDLPEIINLKVT